MVQLHHLVLNFSSPNLYERQKVVHINLGKMLPGLFIGNDLNSGEGWSGDLVIAGSHDIENKGQWFTSEDSSPKRLESQNYKKHLDVLAQTVSFRREGYVQRQT